MTDELVRDLERLLGVSESTAADSGGVAWAGVARAVRATEQPRTRSRSRRVSARASVIGVFVAATTVASAAYAFNTLYRGYEGADELVDTTKWSSVWEEELNRQPWPTGVEVDQFIAVRVDQGQARPDAVPRTDIANDSFALSACAWSRAVEERGRRGDAKGAAEALATIETSAKRQSTLPAATAMIESGLTVYAQATCDADFVGNALDGVQ